MSHMEVRWIDFPSAFRTTAQVNVTPIEGFSLGEALESVYPLLGLVFDYLSYRDLKKVSLVNSTWKAEAEQQMKKRINLSSWLNIYCDSQQNSCGIVDASKNLGFQCVEYSMIFKNNENVHMAHPIEEKFEDKLNDVVGQLAGTDVGCFFIYTQDSISVHPESYINPYSKMSLVDVCLFPIIPNIRVATSVCIPPTDFTEDVFNKSPNEKIKCLLVFLHLFSDLTADDEINQSVFMKKNYRDYAFGGGVNSEIIKYRDANDTDNQYKRTDYFCIGFIENTDGENNNFDAASFVIDDEEENDNYVERMLVQLRRKITIREHSLAFKFSAGVRSYGEAERFHKIFPDTALYGMDVWDQFGWNTKHFNEGENEDSKPQTNELHSLDIVHDRSSVIVFLTWGRIITS